MSCATTSGSRAVPPAGDAPEGVHELTDVADTILEQVPDAAGAVGQELHRVLPFDVLAEHEHRCARDAPACLDGRAQAFVALRGWHADVDHGHVGLVLHDGIDQRRPVADLGDDRAPGFLDQPGDPLADERRILGDDDAKWCGFHGWMMRVRPDPCEALRLGLMWLDPTDR